MPRLAPARAAPATRGRAEQATPARTRRANSRRLGRGLPRTLAHRKLTLDALEHLGPLSIFLAFLRRQGGKVSLLIADIEPVEHRIDPLAASFLPDDVV